MIIPRGAEEARLQINLAEHEFPSYQVMLLTTDGREVFARKGLRPQATRDGNVLIVSVPAVSSPVEIMSYRSAGSAAPVKWKPSAKP